MKEIFYDFRFALIALLAFVALACHSPASHAVSGCGYSDAGRLMKEEAIYDVLPNQMPGQSRLSENFPFITPRWKVARISHALPMRARPEDGKVILQC